MRSDNLVTGRREAIHGHEATVRYVVCHATRTLEERLRSGSVNGEAARLAWEVRHLAEIAALLGNPSLGPWAG